MCVGITKRTPFENREKFNIFFIPTNVVAWSRFNERWFPKIIPLTINFFFFWHIIFTRGSVYLSRVFLSPNFILFIYLTDRSREKDALLNSEYPTILRLFQYLLSIEILTQRHFYIKDFQKRRYVCSYFQFLLSADDIFLKDFKTFHSKNKYHKFTSR